MRSLCFTIAHALACVFGRDPLVVLIVFFGKPRWDGLSGVFYMERHIADLRKLLFGVARYGGIIMKDEKIVTAVLPAQLFEKLEAFHREFPGLARQTVIKAALLVALRDPERLKTVLGTV